MKILTSLTLLLCSLLIFGSSCKKANKNENGDSNSTTCYKGRLEIKNVCGNYTIKVLEGNIDPSLIQTSWTHPTTGKTYQNVFSLGNICNFPASVKEGEDFYFQIRDAKRDPNCVQCLMYEPTPDKPLSIITLTSPCTTPVIK